MNIREQIDSQSTAIRRFLTVLLISLTAIAFVGMDYRTVEAGWYKDAKKKAKKAAKKAQAAAKKAGKNIENEVRTGGLAGTIEKAKGDISREYKRAAGDVSRETKRFKGDVTRESGRFFGDVSREAKKFGGDVSRETKRFGRDINREFNQGLPAISTENVGRGLNRLGKNMDDAGTQFNINTGRGSEQLGHNLTQGERHLTHNIDRGVDSLNRNIFWDYEDTTITGGFLGKTLGMFPLAPIELVLRGQILPGLGALDQLKDNVRQGGTRVGEAVGAEWERGYRNVWNETVGAPRVTDTKTSEQPTGKVCVDCGEQPGSSGSAATARAKKGKTKISAGDASDPAAVFRGETNTGMSESTSIFKERRSNTSLGSSDESSSRSSRLGGSDVSMKKEQKSSSSSPSRTKASGLGKGR